MGKYYRNYNNYSSYNHCYYKRRNYYSYCTREISYHKEYIKKVKKGIIKTVSHSYIRTNGSYYFNSAFSGARIK